MRRLRRLFLLLLLPATGLIAAVLLWGGGSGTDSALADAVEATTRASGARVSMRMSFGASGEVKGGTIVTEGTMDLAGRRMQMELDMASILDGAGLSDTERSELTRLGPGAMRGELRMVGSVMYMRLGMLASLAPEAKPWIEIDLEQAAAELGFDLGQLSDFNDPTKFLEFLRAGGDVEAIGADTVRGTRTTRYRARIDVGDVTDEALAAVPEDQRAGVRKAMKKFVELLDTDEFPVDVWVDDEDLVRRVRMGFALAENAQRFTVDMELYDYGIQVDISAPPRSQVMDLADLMNGGGALRGAR